MFRTCLAVMALSLGLASPALAADDVLHITIDQAHLAKLPANTATVIIGNPSIADITSLKNGVGMVVTGKGYGHTNLIALDAQGNLIDEKEIHVEARRNLLVVQRGNSRQSYSCDPTCMPSVALGDDTPVFSDVSGQVTAHDQLSGKISGAK